MKEETVKLEVHEGIATITLHRPESLNSMNQELVEDLTKALITVGDDKSVRVVILTGSGKGFCAGGDLSYLLTLTDPIAARNFITKVGHLISLIMGLEKPVIGMINGVAAGAGFNLALACDVLICARSARFVQSFAKVGLIPDCGGCYLLPRVVGMHKAKELMFMGDILDADTALQLGIVNSIAEDDVLAESVYDLAKKLSAGPPLALGMIKAMINRSDKLDLESTLEYEADLQSLCMQTADHKEGIAAFKEKRKPVFAGK